MKLVDVLREECIVAGAALEDKAAALRALAAAAKQSPLAEKVSEDTIYVGLCEREALGSTGFGGGIAIPHCRLDDLDEFIVGIVTTPQGVAFDSLDGEPVHLLIFIVGPERGTNEHIKLLSAISQALQEPGAIEEIVAGKSPESVCESFLRHTRADLDTKDSTTKSVFHVFVQDEDKFRDLVQVLAGTETSSVVVIEAENTAAYLAQMPLFAGFWHDEPRRFCRVIVAVAERKLTNETLRRIESVTGDLDKSTGVLVTVQEAAYSAGSLEA